MNVLKYKQNPTTMLVFLSIIKEFPLSIDLRQFYIKITIQKI